MATGETLMTIAANRITRRRRVSVAQYLAMPDDDVKTELIYGEIVVAASARDPHQDFAHNLGEMLRRWVSSRHLGKMSFDLDMILDEEKAVVYRPDLLFLAKAHEQRRKDGRIYGPADLCIEILSPSERPWVQKRKFADYEHYDVRWYWTIQPHPDELLLEEYELRGGVYVVRTEVTGDTWFAPGIFPDLTFRLPPLLEGNLKGAVKGKIKKLM
jgi:Uma2 family endonuclease